MDALYEQDGLADPFQLSLELFKGVEDEFPKSAEPFEPFEPKLGGFDGTFDLTLDSPLSSSSSQSHSTNASLSSRSNYSLNNIPSSSINPSDLTAVGNSVFSHALGDFVDPFDPTSTAQAAARLSSRRPSLVMAPVAPVDSVMPSQVSPQQFARQPVSPVLKSQADMLDSRWFDIEDESDGGRRASVALGTMSYSGSLTSPVMAPVSVPSSTVTGLGVRTRASISMEASIPSNLSLGTNLGSTASLPLKSTVPSTPLAPSPKHHGVHSINGKRISDSRLSLAQLAVVLGLGKDVQETSRREKQILGILRDELEFPLGEKTWIRDTPPAERERLLDELYLRVQQRYRYGYDREALGVVVRRASYYMMQGRLRRERRLSRKKSCDMLAHKRSGSRYESSSPTGQEMAMAVSLQE